MRRLTQLAAVLTSLALLTACAGANAELAAGAGAHQQSASIEPIIPEIPDAGPPAELRRPRQGMRVNDGGVVLPDPELTPGAAFDDVTATDVCQPHYTMGVRQPRYNAKVAAFAGYGVSIRDRDIFKVDHLIPLSLGGSNDETNLWPQPYDDGSIGGAREKDMLERQLRGLVCAGTITLDEATEAISQDWWRAYGHYMRIHVDAELLGPEPWEPAEVAPGEVVNGAECATEGEVGYTDPKHVELTCKPTASGVLTWQKRG